MGVFGLMKKINIFILIVLSSTLIFLTGCDVRGYGGSYPELYAVIANNSLGAGSSYLESISIIEEDSYGRIMFFYSGNDSDVYKNMIDIVGICQKSDKKNTYYYEDDCFFVCKGFDDGLKLSDILPLVQNDIDKLKKLNDWNKELDESKMTSAEKVKNFINKPELNTSLYQIALSAVECSEGYEWNYYIMCSDKVGRQLILMQERRIDYEPSELEEIKTILVIVSNDGKVDSVNGILELTPEQLYDYRDVMKEFKAANHWNSN